MIGEDLSTNFTKPRNAFVALLFSVFLPGLGQVYNGQLRKTLFLYGLYIIIPFLFNMAKVTTSFYGLILLFAIMIGLLLGTHIDAWKSAKRQRAYVLKKYNTWYAYLMIVVVVTSVFWLWYHSSLYTAYIRHFNMPTMANYPTIQLGDKIVADMRAYKDEEPDYGDIVVFSNVNKQLYTFRVIGKPNDLLVINEGIITINNQMLRTRFIQDLSFEGIQVGEYEEELPNGHKHLIYRLKVSYDTMAYTVKIPADSYYLLADNRDFALDSKYIGFVNKEEIKGRILYSYWGKTRKRINFDFRDK